MSKKAREEAEYQKVLAEVKAEKKLKKQKLKLERQRMKAAQEGPVVHAPDAVEESKYDTNKVQTADMSNLIPQS